MSEKCHLPEVLNRTRRERGTPIGLSETTDGTEEDEQKQRKKCLLLRAHPFLFLRYHSQSDAPWLWPTTGVWCCLAVEKDAATAHALRFQLMSHESSPVVNEYESTSLACLFPPRIRFLMVVAAFCVASLRCEAPASWSCNEPVAVLWNLDRHGVCFAEACMPRVSGLTSKHVS